jgi:hypothetical protein
VKVYVASAYKDRALAQSWMTTLNHIGCVITHDWTRAGEEMVKSNKLDGMSETEFPIHIQRHLAYLAFDGVSKADVVWVLLPETEGAGCFIEIGYALHANQSEHRAGRRLITSGPSRRTIFTALADEYFSTHDEAFRWLNSSGHET